MQKGSAQLSLEYLLLLAAFFSVLLLLLPLIQHSLALAFFGFDARQASAFSSQFAETARQLGVFAEGSRLFVEAEPLLEWHVSAKGKKLSVRVFSEQLQKEKTIEKELLLETAPFEKTFSGKTSFALEKRNSTLFVDSNP